MMLSNQAIEEFQAIYNKTFGVMLDSEAAKSKAEQVFLLFKTTMATNEKYKNLDGKVVMKSDKNKESKRLRQE